MAKSNIRELASAIAVKHKLSQQEAEIFVTELFEVLNHGLHNDKQVKVKGLGTFKVIEVKDRESVDVNTGERIVIEGRNKISFTPDSVMKELVNRPFAQFETVVLNDGVDFSDMNNGQTADEQVENVNEVEQPDSVVNNIKEQIENQESVITDESLLYGDAVSETSSDFEPIINGNIENIPVHRKEDIHEEEQAPESTDMLLHESADDSINTNTEQQENLNNQMDMNMEEDSFYGVEVRNRGVSWLWFFISLIVIGSGSFCLGYIMGEDSSFTMVVMEEPVHKNPSGVKQKNEKKDSVSHVRKSVKTEKISDVVKKEESATEKKKENEANVVETSSGQPVLEKNPQSLAQANRMVKTGAYRIIGTSETIRVKKGQTINKIAKRYLGDGMECYVQVHNGVNEVEEGMRLKIPKLQLKKK